MEKLNRSARTLFWISLTWSILMVVGIPMIVFGAVNRLWVLMAVGIAFTGGGFYGVPLFWIAYAGKLEQKTLVDAIERLGLRDVPSLAAHLNRPIGSVREKLGTCLSKGYLPDYIRQEDRLIRYVAPAPEPEKVPHSVLCPCCGARFSYTGMSGVCPYCGVTHVFGQTDAGQKQ